MTTNRNVWRHSPRAPTASSSTRLWARVSARRAARPHCARPPGRSPAAAAAWSRGPATVQTLLELFRDQILTRHVIPNLAVEVPRPTLVIKRPDPNATRHSYSPWSRGPKYRESAPRVVEHCVIIIIIIVAVIPPQSQRRDRKEGALLRERGAKIQTRRDTVGVEARRRVGANDARRRDGRARTDASSGRLTRGGGGWTTDARKRRDTDARPARRRRRPRARLKVRIVVDERRDVAVVGLELVVAEHPVG